MSKRFYSLNKNEKTGIIKTSQAVLTESLLVRRSIWANGAINNVEALWCLGLMTRSSSTISMSR